MVIIEDNRIFLTYNSKFMKKVQEIVLKKIFYENKRGVEVHGC